MVFLLESSVINGFNGQNLGNSRGFVISKSSTYKYLRTASGTPPLSVYAALAQQPSKLVVSGNVDGVGERTENLFDATKLLYKNAPDTFFKIDGDDSILKFTLLSSSTTILFGLWDLGLANNYIGKSIVYHIDGDVVPASTGLVTCNEEGGDRITTGLKKITSVNYVKYELTQTDYGTQHLGLRLYANKPSTVGEVSILKNIMVSIGDGYTPYEPYGYKVPVVVGDKNLLTPKLYNAYTPDKLYARESVNLTSTVLDTLTITPTSAILTQHCQAVDGEITSLIPPVTTDVTSLQIEQLPKLYKGDNVISVDTTVQPSGIEVEYYSSVEALADEQGISLSDEQGNKLGGFV